MKSHVIHLKNAQINSSFIDTELKEKLIFETIQYEFDIKTKETLIPKSILGCIFGNVGSCLFESMYFVENCVIDENFFNQFKNNYEQFTKKSWKNKIDFTITKHEYNISFISAHTICSILIGTFLGAIPIMIFGGISCYLLVASDEYNLISTDMNMYQKYLTNVKISKTCEFDINNIYFDNHNYLVTFSGTNKKGHALGVVNINGKVYTFDNNFGIFEGNCVKHLIELYETNEIVKNVKKIKIMEFEKII